MAFLFALVDSKLSSPSILFLLVSLAIDIFADSLGKSQPTTDWSPGAELREVTGMHRQYVCVDDSALYNLGDSKASHGQSTDAAACTQSYSGRASVQRRPAKLHPQSLSKDITKNTP